MIPLALASALAVVLERLRESPEPDRSSSLEWLILPPGHPHVRKIVGQEEGRLVYDGVSHLRAPGPRPGWEVHRFVASFQGVPVAGLQVLEMGDQQRSVGIYVHPDARRRGLASWLFGEAENRIGSIEHSDPTDQTPAGRAWVAAIEASSPLVIDGSHISATVSRPEDGLAVLHLQGPGVWASAEVWKTPWRDAKAVGLGKLGSIAHQPVLWVEEIVLDDETQGRGNGSQVMRWMEAWGRAQGARWGYLIAEGSGEEDVWPFYEQLGWQTASQAGYSTTMVKPL